MKAIKYIMLLLIIAGVNELYSVTVIDTAKPSITFSRSCDTYTVRITELSRGDTVDGRVQFDKGITRIPSYNPNNFVLDEIVNFQAGQANYDISMIFRIVNPFEDASVEIFAYDDSYPENVNIRKVNYFADKVSRVPENIDFGEVHIGTSTNDNVNLRNPRSSNLRIFNIYLEKGDFFEIENLPTFPLNLTSQQNIDLSVVYSPLIEIYGNYEGDSDNIIIETECLVFKIPLSGRGVQPEIEVSDVFFSNMLVGNRICYNSTSRPDFPEGVKIKNVGTGNLVINGFDLETQDGSFSIYQIFPTSFPIIIPQGDSIYFRDVCFNPQSAGEKSGRLIFSSNAEISDSIAYLLGIGTESQVIIDFHDFGNVRLKDSTSHILNIINNGEAPIFVRRVFIQNDEDFSIEFDRIIPQFDEENPMVIFPYTNSNPNYNKIIQVPVFFHPETEFGKQTLINVEYEDLQGNEFVVSNYLFGYGYLPKVAIKGYDFSPRILVNTTHQDTARVVIRSISESSDLSISNIELGVLFTDNTMDFVALDELQEDFILARNDSLVLRFLFHPIRHGVRRYSVRVNCDAYDGSAKVKSYDTTARITGEAFNKVLYAGSHLFGNVLHCDTAYLEMYLHNVSDTDTARVTDFLFTQAEIESFEILNKPDESNPTVLAPGDSALFRFKFSPHTDRRTFTAYGYFVSVVDSSIVRFFANTYKVNAKFSFDNVIATPGVYTNTQSALSPEFNININCDSLETAKINHIVLRIPFDKRVWNFNGIILPGEALPDDWSITSQSYELNRDSLILEIEAYGENLITSNGSLFRPQLLLLLSEETDYEAGFSSAEFVGRELCMTSEFQNGRVSLYACNLDNRVVNISGYDFEFNQISPNPAEKGLVSVNYQLGIETDYSLKVFDLNGSEIALIDSGRLSAGNYTSFVDLSKVASGKYFIIFETNHFRKTKQLILR